MNAFNTLLAQSIVSTTLVDLMKKETRAAATFSLVEFGVPSVQQQVTKRLLDTAYSEITSLLVSPEFRDYVPVADRGAHLSEYDDEYVGEQRPLTFSDKLDAAVLAGAMVYRFSTHLSAIKGGNAGWATEGFQKDPEWVAVDPKDEHLVEVCAKKGAELLALIASGDNRIRCEVGMVLPSVTSFGEWLVNAINRESKRDVVSKWGMKLATALRVANDELECIDIGIDTVKASIENWANEPAYSRTLTRLEEAVQRAADAKWLFQYEQVIEAGGKIKASPTNEILIAYSPKFKVARETFSTSKELYTKVMECLQVQFKNEDDFDVRNAKKAFALYLPWMCVENQALINESSVMNAIVIQDQRLELARKLQRAEHELEFETSVTKNILAAREDAARLAKVEEQRAAMAALLNPPAPKVKAAKKAAKSKLVA